MAQLKSIEEKLLGMSGESNAMNEAMRHIVTRVTDEGLIVEVFDLPNSPLFKGDTAEPTEIAQKLAAMMGDIFKLVQNDIAVNGHVRNYPVVLRHNPVWDLSTSRAGAMRDMLLAGGLDPQRMQRVTGFADRKPAVDVPTDLRNNRIEIILLRKGKP